MTMFFWSSVHATPPCILHGSPFAATDVSLAIWFPSREQPAFARHSRKPSKRPALHTSARFLSGEHAYSSSVVFMQASPVEATESSQFAWSWNFEQPSGPWHATATNLPPWHANAVFLSRQLDSGPL